MQPVRKFCVLLFFMQQITQVWMSLKFECTFETFFVLMAHSDLRKTH